MVHRNGGKTDARIRSKDASNRDPARLPDLVSAKRRQMRLTQYRTAKLLGTTHSTLMRIENGDIVQPAPALLSKIANVLEIPMADLFAAAGYVSPTELPSVKPYFRARYSSLPESAVRDVERYVEALAKKHGVNLNGPAPGEDEIDEDPTG